MVKFNSIIFILINELLMRPIKPLLSVWVVTCLGFAQNTWAGSIKIYAAASLTNAMTDIAQQYQQEYPDIKVTPVFAASSTLAKQIEAGAPADIFFSADEKWMNYLVGKNLIERNKITALLSNELVLISPKNRPLRYQLNKTFHLPSVIKGKLCTGQTESVPVGIYAKQSLMNLGWFNALKGRIVGTDDVRAALTFVERGECDAGIVYATDAKLSSKVKLLMVFPSNSHQTIVYPVAATKQASPAAISFLNYIQSSSKARAIFVRYGFSVKH